MNKPGRTATLVGGRSLYRVVILLLPTLLWPADVWAATDDASIAAMVARVTPAVVRVVAVRPVQPTKQAPDSVVKGIGAGYIIDPSGYIGTNKHLIDGAIAVFIITAEGERYRAAIVGVTAQADIALLRIHAAERALPFVRFGDSDMMRAGDPVIAIGSPLGFNNTVTSGIVSAINRDIMESPFDDYLQIDAAINHGNSGGPLFNEAGEVIGMTSVIFSPDRGSSGLGFAVPSNSLQFVFDRLIKRGIVGAGMLPFHTQPVTWGLRQAFQVNDLHGALVVSVDDSEIKRLGKIQAGDVITAFNAEKVVDARDLARKIARSPVGSDATLDLHRSDQNATVHVTVEAVPEGKPPTLNEKPQTPGLTLTTETQSNGEHVVRVTSVDPTGTAAEGGFRKGDIVVAIQHTPVSKSEQALRVLRDVATGNRHFAAVLVRHEASLSWIALEVSD
jgi:serine protease Do